jgi:quinolinate synthase
MENIIGRQRRITELKKALNAVIVAHNYQSPEIQAIADFTGDSLELARKCTGLTAPVIVFCGVRFMAETAAILNPRRTVLLAHGSAGCPMADMISLSQLRDWQARFPGATVVSYVNTTAEIKAESYICCTSANGVKVVDSVPGQDVLFVPDRNLGHYISRRTHKHMILYPGFCYVHDRITPEQVRTAQSLHPNAATLVHPECRPEVIDLADAALSTAQMLHYVKAHPVSQFLIGTEAGLLYRMQQENPDKSFFLISPDQICSDMKRTTLETVIATMERQDNRVSVSKDIRVRAKTALDRMLALT